ncbi:MAG: molybdenum cofactor guanylyltransferase MobA [Magnetococcales bacterium]|nr:molybdenum cofactor guanylyltransferase MobA [Magnetococcales bacterium]
MGPALSQVVGLILAGGLARRMGSGADKALLPLAGRPLLAHVMERLSPQVERVVVSANGDPARLAAFGAPVVADLRDGYQGPLAGIEAAFVATDAEWILSVAVDLPFLPTDLLAKMQEPVRQDSDHTMVVAQSAGQCHYVVALWPRRVLPPLTETLVRQQFSLRDWFRQHPHQQRVFAPLADGTDPFFNINRPADLQTAEALYMRQAALPADPTVLPCYRGVE